PQRHEQHRNRGDDPDLDRDQDRFPEQRVGNQVPELVEADKGHVADAVPLLEGDVEGEGNREQPEDREDDEEGRDREIDPEIPVPPALPSAARRRLDRADWRLWWRGNCVDTHQDASSHFTHGALCWSSRFACFWASSQATSSGAPPRTTSVISWLKMPCAIG